MTWALSIIATLLRNPIGRWAVILLFAVGSTFLILLSFMRKGANSERLQQQSKTLEALRDWVGTRESLRDVTRDDLLKEARKWGR